MWASLHCSSLSSDPMFLSPLIIAKGIMGRDSFGRIVGSLMEPSGAIISLLKRRFKEILDPESLLKDKIKFLVVAKIINVDADSDEEGCLERV